MKTSNSLTTVTASAAALLAALALAACPASTGGATKKDGDAAEGGASSSLPTFHATTITGDDFDLADHLGKDVVLISFWATYCEPCKAEMPVLQKLHDSYGDEGLQIVSVSLDGADTVSGVRPYIQTQGYTFPVVVDEDTSIANAYNPRATAPFTVLIGRNGKIIKKVEGFQVSEADELEAEVKVALAGGGGGEKAEQ